MSPVVIVVLSPLRVYQWPSGITIVDYDLTKVGGGGGRAWVEAAPHTTLAQWAFRQCLPEPTGFEQSVGQSKSLRINAHPWMRSMHPLPSSRILTRTQKPCGASNAILPSDSIVKSEAPSEAPPASRSKAP